MFRNVFAKVVAVSMILAASILGGGIRTLCTEQAYKRYCH